MSKFRACNQLFASRVPDDPTWWTCVLERGHAGLHRTTHDDAWATGDEHHVSDGEFWNTMLKNGREHPELIEQQSRIGSGE